MTKQHDKMLMTEFIWQTYDIQYQYIFEMFSKISFAIDLNIFTNKILFDSPYHSY